MTSRIVDLTGSSSPIPLPKRPMGKTSTHPGILPNPKPSIVPPALIRAINTADENRLRSTLKSVLEQNHLLIGQLSKLWLVQGREVVRYHVDSAEEDESERESSEEEEGEDDEAEDSGAEGQLNPIAIKNEESTARWEKCQNCDEEFDVTTNFKGDCNWHPGSKEVYDDDDFWADHDEDCHGRICDFEDDPDMAEGFIWNCCMKTADNEGCKSTKHRAPVNKIVGEPIPKVENPRKRRSDEEDFGRSVKRRG